MRLPDGQVRYIDIPSVQETFGDSFGLSFFDGNNVRLEMCATRLDDPSGEGPPTARKYPVCRLVMTPEATVELFNHLQNMMVALQQAGLVKTEIALPTGATH